MYLYVIDPEVPGNRIRYLLVKNFPVDIPTNVIDYIRKVRKDGKRIVCLDET